MGFMDDLGRVGLGIGTLGLSEVVPDFKQRLLGGRAAEGYQSDPQTGAFQRDYLKQFLNRGAPGMNAGQSDQTRAQQQNLATQLQRISSGQQAGAGELAVNRQVGQGVAAQQAQAQMARGANAALAARQAARTSADIGVTGAGMAQGAALQDQANAHGQLAGLLDNMRGQDIGTAQGNQQAQMQQQSQQLQALAQMLGVDTAQLQAELQKRQLANADQGMLPGLVSGAAQAAASGAASDERVKHSVFDANEAVDTMLDTLKPKRFYYQDPQRHGHGERVGIMAQDLELSDAGRELVTEVDDIKMVDLQRAIPVLLASVARLNARIRELERR